MVISALTIYFLASLPGEAQKFKMKAEAMPIALLSCREWRGRGLSFPRQGSRKRSLGTRDLVLSIVETPVEIQ